MIPTHKTRERAIRRNLLSAAYAMTLTASAAIGAAAQGGSVDKPFVLERSYAMSEVPPGPYSDYLALDPRGGKLFATPQAAKAVAVIDLKDDRVVYRKLQSLDTAVMAKTGLYSSELDRMYVSVPHLGNTPAQIMVFAPAE